MYMYMCIYDVDLINESYPQKDYVSIDVIHLWISSQTRFALCPLTIFLTSKMALIIYPQEIKYIGYPR